MKVMREGLKVLENYLAAIRHAEYDDANQLHSLLALTKVKFHEENYGRLPDAVAKKIDQKIQDRILSPALVITAWFSCSWERADLNVEVRNDLPNLKERVHLWMTRSKFVARVVQFLAKKKNDQQTYCMSTLVDNLTQFDELEKTQLKEDNGRSLTIAKFDNVLNFMRNNNLKALADVVEIIKDTPSSEASAERGFSTLDRFLPKKRFKLHPQTAAMHVRYATFHRSLQEIEKREGDLFQELDATAHRLKTIEISNSLPENVDDDDDLLALDEEKPKTDAQCVAEAVVSVIDLALEKATKIKNFQTTAVKKIAKKCSKVGCDATANATDELCYLIVCTGKCGETKCNDCWGIGTGHGAWVAQKKQERWMCASCKNSYEDNWFAATMAQMEGHAGVTEDEDVPVWVNENV